MPSGFVDQMYLINMHQHEENKVHIERERKSLDDIIEDISVIIRQSLS